MTSGLPPLDFEAWRPAKNTLHLWCQIIGKTKLSLTPRRNHWWNVTLYVSARGLTTAGAGLAGWDLDDTRTDWCPILPIGGHRG